MSEEIKKHLDSTGLKFKDVDEDGTETILSLSELIDKMVIDNNNLGKLLEHSEEIRNKAIEYMEDTFVVDECDKCITVLYNILKGNDD